MSASPYELLSVREAARDEWPMVLSNWKRDLFDQRFRKPWGRGLRDQDYWRLMNHVLDRITFPSVSTFVATHQMEPEVVLAWVAVRDGLLIYTYARRKLRETALLADAVIQDVLEKLPVAAIRAREFNPYEELER
jgi:hypothetical protein